MAITTTANQEIKASVVDKSHYLEGLQVINSGATATEFLVKDGTTVVFKTILPALMNQISSIIFARPIKCSVNSALNVSCGSLGAVVYCNSQGYTL